MQIGVESMCPGLATRARGDPEPQPRVLSISGLAFNREWFMLPFYQLFFFLFRGAQKLRMFFLAFGWCDQEVVDLSEYKGKVGGPARCQIPPLGHLLKGHSSEGLQRWGPKDGSGDWWQRTSFFFVSTMYCPVTFIFSPGVNYVLPCGGVLKLMLDSCSTSQFLLRNWGPVRTGAKVLGSGAKVQFWPLAFSKPRQFAAAPAKLFGHLNGVPYELGCVETGSGMRTVQKQRWKRKRSETNFGTTKQYIQ